MNYFTIILVILVAVLHIYFMVLEMFLWKKPLGRKIFHLEKEFAEKSATLAANQGLYNGILAAGLIWGLLIPVYNHQVIAFFLIAVFVAGVFGAFTVNKRILWIQSVPALLALVLLYFNGLG